MTNQLIPIEMNNQRILTTQQLAAVYETDTNNITTTTSHNHKDHFVEGDTLLSLKRRGIKRL